MSLNLADRFEQLPEMAGINHFARVFKGHDYVNDSDVAILELLPSVLKLAASDDLAWQTIERMWKVRTPSLIEKIALVKERNWIVVAWNPKDCSSLSGSIVQEKEAAQWMGQALLGLAAIHKDGLIHGDIKPASLLLDPKDQRIVRLAFSPGLYIGDLAVDRGTDQMNQAPELLRTDFGDPGPQTDLYCLAFTILQIAAGPHFTKAFSSGGNAATQWARWHGDPSKSLPSATTVAPHLSESFASLLDTMLSKNVNARPASAEICQRMLGAIHPDAIILRAQSSIPSKQDSNVIHMVSDSSPSVKPIPVSQKADVLLPVQPERNHSRQRESIDMQDTNKIPKGSNYINPRKPANKVVVVASLMVATLAVAATTWFLVLQDIVARSTKALLVVSILPVDAQVSFDEYSVPLKDGTAKLKLAPGKYTIRATKDGFDSYEENISVELPDAKETSIPERRIQLIESEIAITFDLNPADADVLIDDKAPVWTSAKNPEDGTKKLLMLRPGNYKFTLQKEGHVSSTVQQVVTQSTKDLHFDPLLIKYQVNVEPADAKIVLADAKPIDGSKQLFAVGPGKHLLSVSHPGFEPVSQEIDVSASNRSQEIVLTPSMVQFELKLPKPDIKITCDGNPLIPNPAGKYSLRPGEYKMVFQLGKEFLDGDQTGLWEKQIKVEPDMSPVVVEIPQTLATKMATMNPEDGSQSNPSNSKLRKVLVHVYPPNASNIKIVLDGNPIELMNGEGSIAYNDLQSSRKSVELRVLRDNRTEFEEFISRESLESQGEIATINHSISLSDIERARKLWLFARTAVKIVPKEAVAALDEALELDPTLAAAYRERAIAKNELDLISEADEDVVKALASMPSDYSTLSVGGIVASKMFLKTTGAAEKASLSLATSRLNQAIERYPKRTSARMMRAQLHYWAGDKKSARDDLVALLGLTQEPDQLSYVKSQLGTIATEVGEIEAAMQLFNEAIELRKGAELSTTVPQFNKAKAILEHARRIQKEDASKARSFFELAKAELLVLDGRKDLSSPEFLAMLAEIEATLGNYQSAIKFYTSLINSGVITPIILKNRAAAFEAAGDKKSAEEDRAKALQLQKS